jgi:hypothetical protein
VELGCPFKSCGAALDQGALLATRLARPGRRHAPMLDVAQIEQQPLDAQPGMDSQEMKSMLRGIALRPGAHPSGGSTIPVRCRTMGRAIGSRF